MSCTTQAQCVICLEEMLDVEKNIQEFETRLGRKRAEHAESVENSFGNFNGSYQYNCINPLDIVRDPCSPTNRDKEDSLLAAHLQKNKLQVLGCGHTFHRTCVQPWLQSKPYCPICKVPAEILSPDFSDRFALGTSFQSSFLPHTLPLTRSNDNQFNSSLTGCIDTNYILSSMRWQ